jgi:eukaryotic-like serine/threonine-protein kinase
MTDSREKLTAALSDRYRLERELGKGGMATVYLAHDVRHDRKVAVKVLRPELAAVLGADRFVQEIRTTAQLQHPHILPLFDSGEADGFLFYVMPYVEGETLRNRLDRETQLDVEEAVRITREVADALDYAHRHGIVHRDIKPENILLHDGRPTVADFGIALALSAAAGGRMTETGMSLGTPHYMSPEQATADKDITGRSDIYSLASVLYEMLAGEPPHTGTSAQQIIMKIVTEDVSPITRLRKSVPPNVAAALDRALEKLPADRFNSAKSFADALADPGFTSERIVASGPKGVPRDWRTRAAIPLLVIAVLATVLAAWGWAGRLGSPPLPVSRYQMTLPDSEAPGIGILPRLALLPDGSAFVYPGPPAAGGQLFMRPRNALHATPIAGSENAFMPFPSPDGTQVGFVHLNPMQIRVVPLVGGSPRVVSSFDFEAYGQDWGTDQFIYVGSRSGLWRVPASGGNLEAVTSVNTRRGESGHINPQVLPGGRFVLFTVLNGPELARAGIAVVDTDNGDVRVLTTGLRPWYVSSGHVVFVDAGGDLYAAPFDLRSQELTGDAVRMASDVRILAAGMADLALSASGDLVYVTGRVDPEPDDLVWVTRDGQVTPVTPPWKADFSSLALSPNGLLLAITVRTIGGLQVWLRDLNHGSVRRLTLDGNTNSEPVWRPDGQAISFVSRAPGRTTIFTVPADGSAAPEHLLDVDGGVSDLQWSPDGVWLVLRHTGAADRDVVAFRPGTDTVLTPVAAAIGVEESSPRLSHDGRWLAYVSDETGRNEVFVRPFPGDGPKQQVSLDGGEQPRWARSGRELFFRDASNQMTAVQLQMGATIVVGARRSLFDWGELDDDRWDVAPDDRGFLFVRTPAVPKGALVVVENFAAELEAKVPR